MAKTYFVKVIREPGPEPITGNFYGRAEEDLEIEAPTITAAYRKSQILSTLCFRGQLRRTYINGTEYFDERR